MHTDSDLCTVNLSLSERAVCYSLKGSQITWPGVVPTCIEIAMGFLFLQALLTCVMGNTRVCRMGRTGDSSAAGWGQLLHTGMEQPYIWAVAGFKYTWAI